MCGNEADGTVPGADTVWTVEGNGTLTPTTPVTLTYTNDKGLTFKRTIAVDPEYMFTVSDTCHKCRRRRRFRCPPMAASRAIDKPRSPGSLRAA